jgi:heme exporter protein A
MTTSGAPVSLEVSNVAFLRNENVILNDVRFSLAPGELLQIDGANGSGKSTLLRILAGLLDATEGDIVWRGGDCALTPAQIRDNLTYLGHKNAIKDDLSSLENLDYITLLKRSHSGIPACEALRMFNLAHTAQTPTGRLSAGQKRKIALSRLLVSATRCWLLDEPFTALDQDGKKILEGIIKHHVDTGGMVVFATHQAMEIEGCNVRHYHLDPS